MTTRLAFAGENISAGSSVILDLSRNLVFSAGEISGEYVGNTVENIREGFRVAIKDGEVREDDA